MDSLLAGRKASRKQDAEDVSSRGQYESIAKASSRRGLLGIPFALALLLGGLGFMLIHHFFFKFLDGKSIDSATGELSSVLRDQRNVNFISTTIAHGARAVLSMAVGITLVQLFWETLRSRSSSIEEVDALIKCGQSPFQTSAIRAARASVVVFVVSCVASAMALIVILVPGSLTISTALQRHKTCTVPTVPNLMETPYSENSQLEYSATGILVANSYLPPFRAVNCDDGATSCSYNVSFVGPAFDCVDITNKTDFTQLRAQAANSSASVLIWNGTLNFQEVENDLGLPMVATVITLDMVKGETQANNCTMYNATYDVGVFLENDTTSLQVWNTSLLSVTTMPNFQNTFMFVYSYVGIFGVEGQITAGSNGFSNGAFSQLQNTAFFVTTPDGNHTWSGNITDILTSYMQNVSLSLLSGQIYTGFSNETATNFEFVNSTCSSVFTAYAYDSPRLLGTYGSALFLTALVLIPAFWLILRNDTEDKLVLSHIVRMSLNASLMHSSRGVGKNTQVRLQRGGDGKLLPATPGSGEDVGSASKEHAAGMNLGPSRRRFITVGEGQMLALIVIGVVCAIFHHLYYHYLNWKAPTSSLHDANLSSFLRNQSIVSDIGLALSYIAQTVFVAAIGIASSQLFWRSLRSRGHTLNQIDALMKAQTNPISVASFTAARVSFIVLLVALLATGMSTVSIFAPGSIKVSFNRETSESCTVKTFRNLTSLTTSNTSDYTTPVGTVLTKGTFVPPFNPCSNSGNQLGCSYDLELVGPGFQCQDVTPTSGITPLPAWTDPGPNVISGDFGTYVYYSSITPQTEDLSIRLSVATYDTVKRLYQSVNCTGVVRSYSVTVHHSSGTAPSTIDVHNSSVLSVVRAQKGVDLSQSPGNGSVGFIEDYIVESMSFLVAEITALIPDRPLEIEGASPTQEAQSWYMSGLGTYEIDGNFTWRDNMTVAMEEVGQNLTLSILSSEIFAFNGSSANGNDGSLLEDLATTCNFTLTAYEYTPLRLFLTYGSALLVTALCMLGGFVAIRKNGVEETMGFSRFLGAVLNERMYRAEGALDTDKNFEIKASDDTDGSFAPVGGFDMDINAEDDGHDRSNLNETSRK